MVKEKGMTEDKNQETEKDKQVHFCVECQFVEDAPGRHFTCPACGGKMMTQMLSLMTKARKQNADKRGV